MKTKLAAAVFCCVLSLTTSVAFAQQPIMMTKATVRDSMAVHKEAVSFLVPHGWRMTGGINWYLNMAHQACVEVKIANPNGLEQVETLPYAQCTWLTNPVFPMQVGSTYMGQVVRYPIADPAEVIRQIALPSLRPGARIVGSQ